MTKQITPLKQWPFSKKERKIFFESMLKYQCFWTRPRYKFSAGFRGPFYGDVRKIISDPKILEIAGKRIAKILKALKADVVAACSMSGDAWAVAASLYGKTPIILLRKEPHFHGPKSIICGFPFNKKSKMVILEDGIASGGQLIKFYRNLRKEGYKNIKDIVTIMDLFHFGPASKYKEKFFRKSRLKLNYIFSMQEYLNYLCKNRYITPEYHKILSEWFADPVTWSNNRQNWKLLNKLENQGRIFFKSPIKPIKGARL